MVRPAQCLALVLAGGQSRRMGVDKLQLPRPVMSTSQTAPIQITILQHVVDVCATVANEVWVLTPPEPRFLTEGSPPTANEGQTRENHREPELQRPLNDAVKQFADEAYFRGPLAALAHAWPLQDALNVQDVLVVAGDLPGLTTLVLKTCLLTLRAQADDIDAVLIERDSVLQPLLGAYRQTAGETLVRAAMAGETRLMYVARQLAIKSVVAENSGWPVWWTTPVHTSKDYANWLEFQQGSN